MQISRDEIVEHLKQLGKADQAERAAAELPEQIDAEDEQGLLAGYDVDPKQLLSEIGSGIGDEA